MPPWVTSASAAVRKGIARGITVELASSHIDRISQRGYVTSLRNTVSIWRHPGMAAIAQDGEQTTTWKTFGTAQLHGWVEGAPDERPPLVLLHGLTFDHRMWLPAIVALRERDPGRQLLVLDLPGHGGSPMMKSSMLSLRPSHPRSTTRTSRRPWWWGSGVIAAIYATTYAASGLVDVDQELDSSFVGLLQANREAVTGPGFAALWPGILASMHMEQLPAEARILLRTDLPPQDVVARLLAPGSRFAPDPAQQAFHSGGMLHVGGRAARAARDRFMVGMNQPVRLFQALANRCPASGNRNTGCEWSGSPGGSC